MTRWATRTLWFQLTLLWQGGFLFYSAVVVPVGTDQLGAFEQGLVTQRVTWWLNLFGFLWAAAALLELWGGRREPRAAFRLRLGLWGLMLAAAVALALLHPRMGDLLDAEAHAVLDRRAFRRLHIVYLWLSTAQWALTLVYGGLTVRAWGGPTATTKDLP